MNLSGKQACNYGHSSLALRTLGSGRRRAGKKGLESFGCCTRRTDERRGRGLCLFVRCPALSVSEASDEFRIPRVVRSFVGRRESERRRAATNETLVISRAQRPIGFWAETQPV